MLLASCMKDKSIQENIQSFKTFHEYIVMFWILCAVVVSSMSGYLVSGSVILLLLSNSLTLSS